MAEKKDGFQSGAGLIRYFDEEEITGPALDPKRSYSIDFLV